MDVTSLSDIRSRIERATERRLDLWQRLGNGHDPALAAELKQLEADIAALWDEHRIARARLRFGDRDKIVARARTEERLARAA